MSDVSPLADNLPPTSDIFAMSTIGTPTLTFSVPADNLSFAIVGTYGAAPEPGTMAVLLTGIGFLGAAAARRRRSRK